MAYDVRADRVILFGGNSGGALLNDTWAYDITNDTWTNVTPQKGPSPRAWPQMAYDNWSGRVILFSGEDDVYRIEGAEDTWAYDYGSNTWTNLTPPLLPPSRFWGSLAYDAATDRMVLFGGLHNRITVGWLPLLNDTWTYDYGINAWTEQPPTSTLNLSALGGMAYDARDDAVLLYRGLATSYSEWSGASYIANDTWRSPGTGQTWTQLATKGQVPRRWGVGMVYDAHADKTILFGGCTRFLGPPCFADTWAFEAANATWMNVTGVGAPSPRASPGITYARNGMTILFGGGMPNGLSTWASDNDTWVYVCGLPSFPELTVVASATPLNGVPPLAVAFTTSVSGGSPPYTYSWDFGDGSHGTETSPSHTYASAGHYTVTLVVRDAGGRTLTKTLAVAVNPPSGSLLQLDATGWALVAVLLAVVTGLVVSLLRRKPRGEESPPSEPAGPPDKRVPPP